MAALSIAACSADKSGGKIASDPAWAPEKLTSVKGVPAAEIETELKQRLAGSAPAQIDVDQWAQTKRLYKLYGDSPLWLAPDGLHSARAFALANAVLQAEQDGMRLDAYPVGALAEGMAAVQQSG